MAPPEQSDSPMFVNSDYSNQNQPFLISDDEDLEFVSSQTEQGSTISPAENVHQISPTSNFEHRFNASKGHFRRVGLEDWILGKHCRPQTNFTGNTTQDNDLAAHGKQWAKRNKEALELMRIAFPGTNSRTRALNAKLTSHKECREAWLCVIESHQKSYEKVNKRRLDFVNTTSIIPTDPSINWLHGVFNEIPSKLKISPGPNAIEIERTTHFLSRLDPILRLCLTLSFHLLQPSLWSFPAASVHLTIWRTLLTPFTETHDLNPDNKKENLTLTPHQMPLSAPIPLFHTNPPHKPQRQRPINPPKSRPEVPIPSTASILAPSNASMSKAAPTTLSATFLLTEFHRLLTHGAQAWSTAVPHNKASSKCGKACVDANHSPSPFFHFRIGRGKLPIERSTGALIEAINNLATEGEGEGGRDAAFWKVEGKEAKEGPSKVKMGVGDADVVMIED
ncbi:MAG: hypothetical protein Q9227_004676 [Pyrenula ochraceoflavens]